jgi:DNA-directed RNA polymerase specialized sigma24 family protein
VAGLSLQEIANSYTLTLSAAKMRLYRAIEQLRALVRDTDLKL